MSEWASQWAGELVSEWVSGQVHELVSDWVSQLTGEVKWSENFI